MKRSEMVEHIKAELEELLKGYHNVSEKRYPHWINGKASGILDMLEGFGILPPQAPHLVVPPLLPKPDVLYLHEWEPEDEKK